MKVVNPLTKRDQLIAARASTEDRLRGEQQATGAAGMEIKKSPTVRQGTGVIWLTRWSHSTQLKIPTQLNITPNNLLTPDRSIVDA